MGVRVPTFAPTICSSSAEAATSTVTTFVTTSPTFPSGTEGSLGAESEQTRAQLHHAEDERLRPHATPSLETKARCSQKTGRGNLERGILWERGASAPGARAASDHSAERSEAGGSSLRPRGILSVIRILRQLPPAQESLRMRSNLVVRVGAG